MLSPGASLYATAFPALHHALGKLESIKMHAVLERAPLTFVTAALPLEADEALNILYNPSEMRAFALLTDASAGWMSTSWMLLA